MWRIVPFTGCKGIRIFISMDGTYNINLWENPDKAALPVTIKTNAKFEPLSTVYPFTVWCFWQ